MILANEYSEKAHHWHALLPDLKQKVSPVVKPGLSKQLIWLDLSASNTELAQLDVVNTDAIGQYINGLLTQHRAAGALGGYLENRLLYLRSQVFAGEEHRTLHLGLDIWLPAGEAIYAVLPGKVHSFADNANFGDYGPTIILEHTEGSCTFYTLYGHLSRASLEGIYSGKAVAGCELLATLGAEEENGHWPPHLHLQVMLDMEGRQGDFPGVAAPSQMAYYQQLCPDPNLLLAYPAD